MAATVDDVFGILLFTIIRIYLFSGILSKNVDANIDLYSTISS